MKTIEWQNWQAVQTHDNAQINSTMLLRVPFNHQSNLFFVFYLFINDAWLVRFLSWLRVTTQLTGRSGTGEKKCVSTFEID